MGRDEGEGAFGRLYLYNRWAALHDCAGIQSEKSLYLWRVELEEGGRVDARIEGVDAGEPEKIKVGMPLKVKFLHREEGGKKETYLAFEPDKSVS